MGLVGWSVSLMKKYVRPRLSRLSLLPFLCLKLGLSLSPSLCFSASVSLVSVVVDRKSRVSQGMTSYCFVSFRFVRSLLSRPVFRIYPSSVSMFIHM